MVDRSIGRTDLVSPISEPNSPDPVLESYFRQQLEQLYADPSQALATNDGTEVDQIRGASVEQVQTEDREEYDFRLFTRPHASGTASVGASNGPQRIAIRSPSPAGGESGFTSAGRPDNYYFAGDTGAELAEQYARAAVSGQDIVEGLKMRWVCRFVLYERWGPDLWYREAWSCRGESPSSRRQNPATWWG